MVDPFFSWRDMVYRANQPLGGAEDGQEGSVEEQ
jgi:hypothetical protein